MPAAVFELALPLLASKAIGWLVAEPFTPALPVSPPAPAVSAPVPRPPVSPSKPEVGELRPTAKKAPEEPQQHSPPPAPSPPAAGHPAASQPAGRIVRKAPAPTVHVRFEPVRRGLYRREYEAMLADAEREMRAIRDQPGHYHRCLRPEAADLIALLTREVKSERATEVRRRQDSWQREGMHPEAAARLATWQQRQAEIKAAMNGVIAAEAASP